MLKRLPSEERAAKRAMVSLSPQRYLAQKARVDHIKNSIKLLPAVLASRHIPTEEFPDVKPVRCSLPKKQQRNLGLLPHLPNAKLCLAA